MSAFCGFDHKTKQVKLDNYKQIQLKIKLPMR